MRIGIVAEWVDAWRGGAETSTLQFIHCLMERGIEVHLFTRSRPSPTPGLLVHTVGGASMSRTRQTVTFAHRVDLTLRSIELDLVHAISPCLSAHIYQPRGGTVAETIERNIALRRSKAAQSVKRCANRLNLKQRYQLAVERKLFGNSNAPTVVAISDYVVRQLRHHYALPDSRIRKIYNGVTPESTSEDERDRDRNTIRSEFGIPKTDLLVLTIAHNFRLKGVQRWMEALARLINEDGVNDVRSLVIGKGDSKRWHDLAARMNLNQHLTFTGPTERVHAFMHAADVLVHPTYYDPCSRVVLEAMAGGLPCVTTCWDGASEMVRDGVSGYVLDDPWDVEALADRVKRLRDGSVRQRFGHCARESAETLTMDRHASEMIQLYEELMVAGARA